MTLTEYTDKVSILAELFTDYKEDKFFKELIEFNDLGFPLAYLEDEGLCTSTKDGQRFIEETFEILLNQLGVSLEDTYETLDDVLSAYKP